MKQHLPGVTSQVVSYVKVPHDACHRMIVFASWEKRKLVDAQEHIGELESNNEPIAPSPTPIKTVPERSANKRI